MLGFIHSTSAKGKLLQIKLLWRLFPAILHTHIHKPLAMTLLHPMRSIEENPLVTTPSCTLTLRRYSDASGEIEGFYDGTFCFCPRSLDMEHSFRCLFLFAQRGPGLFDCVIRGQNGILSCLLRYNLLGLIFKDILCLFVMMERLGGLKISNSMLATCGVLLCLFVWLVASQKKRGLL